MIPDTRIVRPAVATVRVLRRRGLFAGRTEPDLLRLLDLVSLATVCDVMPLTGVNRALVCQGLKVMTRRARPGIAALLAVAPRKAVNGNRFAPEGGTLKDQVESLEKHIVAEALARHRWNQSRAADELGLSRVGLANKIRRYGLDKAS